MHTIKVHLIAKNTQWIQCSIKTMLLLLLRLSVFQCIVDKNESHIENGSQEILTLPNKTALKRQT